MEAWARSNHDKAKDKHGRWTLGHDGAFESCPYPVCASCRALSASALTAFRALSQQWKNTEFMLEDGNPYDRVAEAMRQRCKADLDALLVSLSALKE